METAEHESQQRAFSWRGAVWDCTDCVPTKLALLSLSSTADRLCNNCAQESLTQQSGYIRKEPSLLLALPDLGELLGWAEGRVSFHRDRIPQGFPVCKAVCPGLSSTNSLGFMLSEQYLYSHHLLVHRNVKEFQFSHSDLINHHSIK